MSYRPQVGAPPTIDGEAQKWQADIINMDGVNFHLAGRPVDYFARSGEVIKSLPVDLDSTVHRRHLFDSPDELGQSRCDFATGEGGWIGDLFNVALCIVGVAPGAEPYGHAIPLGARNHVFHQPRGLAEADRQYSLGQGVQRSSVPHFPPLAGDALDPPQCLHGGNAGRLVQVQKPMDRRFGPTTGWHGLTLPGRCREATALGCVGHLQVVDDLHQAVGFQQGVIQDEPQKGYVAQRHPVSQFAAQVGS